jgi:hypothetical protein
MIVLDEHLNGLGVEAAIRQWYRGRVCGVAELRPGSVIKDDAIPHLLRTEHQPTFVTLNWKHFWQRTAAHSDFCVVCLVLTTEHAREISPSLRRLLRLPEFKTRAVRMGRVARISGERVAYYRVNDDQTYLIPLP